jgi:hypothetical protein
MRARAGKQTTFGELKIGDVFVQVDDGCLLRKTRIIDVVAEMVFPVSRGGFEVIDHYHLSDSAKVYPLVWESK